MPYRLIDMDSYPRRAHFEYFSSLAYPYAGVTVEVDATEIVDFCRTRKVSFYLTFLHAVALAADGIPELRQRIRDGAIIEYDACPTSHVELLDNGTYCYCTLRHHMDLADYLSYAERTRRAARERGGIEEDGGAEDKYFVSTVPWLHYSSLVQPVGGGNDSNPRFVWGKYAADEHGRFTLPVSLLVHHALVDGVHIAAFYRNLEEQIRQF